MPPPARTGTPPAGAPGHRSSHLRWPGLPQLPQEARAALVGPGAPFEIVTEPVAGHDHPVFARRPRTLRQMLDAQAASTPDLPFLIGPRRQWTYTQALADIDATASLLAQRYGVSAGERVAIVAANHPEYAILMWATIITAGSGRACCTWRLAAAT
jgi:non-ribosomal peptide synthetase component F